jgi:ABC-type multidrug transport system permease subunit
VLGLRLLLLPAWLRFVVLALFLAVTLGLLLSLESREDIASNVLSAIFSGAATAGLLTATSQAAHRGALEALSALDDARRSEAINAISRGVVPADPGVRAAAIRLGRAWLRNKSPKQLKRVEISNWIAFGLLFVVAVVAAVVNFNNDRVFYTVLAALSAIVAPRSSHNTRRIQRNIARLAENPIPG